MSHGDQLVRPPKDFVVVGKTDSAPYACIAHPSKPIYGIQFHPEVTHSLRGKEVFQNFVLHICKCHANWTMVGGITVNLSCSHNFHRKSSSTRNLGGLGILLVRLVR